ncbi:MAG: hypothetical protein IJ728_02260, partial [Selenomonadaceae bacterium]|nr:hypothetical protein [Selenomonadaceae bacterium]
MIAPVKFVDFQGTVRKVYSNNENKNNIVTLGNGSYVVDAIFLANDDINCHVLVGRYTSINNGIKFLIG